VSELSGVLRPHQHSIGYTGLGLSSKRLLLSVDASRPTLLMSRRRRGLVYFMRHAIKQEVVTGNSLRHLIVEFG